MVSLEPALKVIQVCKVSARSGLPCSKKSPKCKNLTLSQTVIHRLGNKGLAAKGKCLTLKCKSATKLTLKCKISKTKKTAFTTSKATKYLDKDGRQRLKLDTKSYNNHSNNNQNLTASANARANNRQPRPSGAPASF